MRIVNIIAKAALIVLLVFAAVQLTEARGLIEPDEFFILMDAMRIKEEPAGVPEEAVILPQVSVAGEKEKSLADMIAGQGVRLRGYKTPEGGRVDFGAETYLAFDERQIYILKKLEKPLGYELKARRYDVPESAIWEDDNIEIFLDPFLTRQEYYQLIVNPLGEFWDSRFVQRMETDPMATDPRELRPVRDGYPEWSSQAETRGEVDVDYWRMLVSVPFSAFGFETAPVGAVWGANFCHTNRYNNQLSQWTVTSGEGGFHQPHKFGAVLFGVEEEVGVGVDWDLGCIGYGSNYARVGFENAGEEREGEIVLSVADDSGKELSSHRFRGTIPRGESEAKIPFVVPFDRGREFRVSGWVEGEGVSGSFRRLLHLGDVLELRVEHDNVFTSDESVEGTIMLGLGEGTLEETELVFRVKGGARVAEARLEGPSWNFLRFGIDIDLFEMGEQILEVEGRAGRRFLGRGEVLVTAVEAPFGF